MISLTRPQRALLRFIVIERAQGREPTLREIAVATGKTGKTSSYKLRKGIEERLGKGAIEQIVPRGPDGARLRFIPFESLKL